MKTINNLKLTLFITLLSFFTGSKLFSQTGSIAGFISDENGISVPGANVVIENLKKGAFTDFDGRFTLLSIPKGTYTLKVSYLGYKDITKEVEVKDKETTSVKLELASSSFQLEMIQISAALRGQAKALNKQKNNINITNVVSTDQIGKFPDANIGDAVKRIQGITMQVDQGEARNIIVRGLSPQLNSVTLNGSRIPSAEGDNRNVQMDLIPSDMIQSIEVSKAVTPDMDADAIGGSVNLISRTTPQGFRISSTLGSGINTITDKRILNGFFLVGDRSKNEKFGWMLSASFNDNDFGSDNIEAEWTDSFSYADTNGDEVEMDVNPYTNINEIRTYLVQRIRRSFSANFNYDFNANNNIYLKSMYNWRDDRENRFRLEQEMLDWDDINEGDFTISNGIPTRFPVEVKRQSKGGIDNSRNKNRRLEDQRMQNYTLGGTHVMGKLKFDWMSSYAKASEERLNERYAEYESEYIINNDNTDPKFPVFTPVNESDFNDLSSFEFGEITEESQYTEEEDFNFFANFELPSDFFGKGDGTLKFGARGRFKKKIRDNNFFEFDLESAYPTLADIPTKNYTDADYLAGERYVSGLFASEEWLGTLDLNNGDSKPDEFLRGNFNVEENVWAAYAMANQKLSDKLNILFGVRFENTKTTATGNNIENEEDFKDATTVENTYSNFMPSVHLKYNATDNMVFRFAWTNTIARPNYVDLTPFRDVVVDDQEIYSGNPNLNPTTSMNFDLNFENYLSNVGIISAGAFYKNVNDFIYTFIGEDEATGFDLFQPLNGDDASIFGLEVGFQRQLDFLPGFLKNLSFYGNYTYISSSANGIRNEDGDLRDDMDLPNTSPNMFNASLAYATKKFSARLSTNFSDAYLDELGGNAFEDRYYDKQFFLDFNATYAFNKNLRIYADVNNITNQPLRYYQGTADRTMQMEYYGQRIALGLKYDLFKK